MPALDLRRLVIYLIAIFGSEAHAVRNLRLEFGMVHHPV